MDSEKILTQTSELASLEAASNTNKALEDLSQSLESSNQYMAVSAIGKMGSLGTDSLSLDESGSKNFEIYLPTPLSQGTLSIQDTNGNVVKTVQLSGLPSGTNTFTWDGTDENGQALPAGNYRVSIDYITNEGTSALAVYGVYPIESVRFDGGKSYLKMGSQYIPLENVKEIYEG
jgi:flagellar basal-body rod modification protein FlgD